MKSGLEFLDRLDAATVDWVFRHGYEMPFVQGDLLVEGGTRGKAILVLLSGVADVSTTPDASGRLATLGPGDIVGEMAFLEDLPSSAYVVAREEGSALSLDCAKLRAQLGDNPTFGRALYRAFAQMLSSRFRQREAAWLATRPSHVNEPAARLWSRISPHLDEFKRLVVQCDHEAIQHDVVPDDLADKVKVSFAAYEQLLDQTLGDAASESETTKAEVGVRVQAEMLPYLLMSENCERWYAKPRGYAGDFLSIARMYDNEARGVGRLGPLLDRCFLDLAAVRAVQNRRAILAEEIQATVAACSGRTAHVTSLASGPAQEVFDVYETLPDPTVLKATLIDIDLQALAYVADRAAKKRFRRQLELANENLVYLATGRRRTTLTQQDLVYSVGLIDYFTDSFVIQLMSFIHGTLRPGGRLVLGNFHPRNVTKAIMDHVVDWKLIHRTEEDLSRLFQVSAFGRPCTRIRFEPQGVNLFAECVKS